MKQILRQSKYLKRRLIEVVVDWVETCDLLPPLWKSQTKDNPFLHTLVDNTTLVVVPRQENIGK